MSLVAPKFWSIHSVGMYTRAATSNNSELVLGLLKDRPTESQTMPYANKLCMLACVGNESSVVSGQSLLL